MSEVNTQTKMMFDTIIERVMLFLRAEDCFGSPDEDGDLDQEVLDFYGAEVEAAVASVFAPEVDVVAVYTFDDVVLRFMVVAGAHPQAFGISGERCLEILNGVVHGREMQEMFEHLFDQAIIRELDK